MNRAVDWTVVRRLATGSIPASVGTLAVLSRINVEGATATQLITTVLAAALFMTAAALIFRKALVAICGNRLARLSSHQVAVLTILVGAILGVLVSLTSVGAGAIGVTALVLLYPRLPIARIVGSDIAHAVPLTLVAGIGHWLLGSIDISIFSSLIVGSIPGIIISSYVASRIPERVLRFAMAVVLFITASKLSLDSHHTRTGSLLQGGRDSTLVATMRTDIPISRGLSHRPALR
jgi:uncharacterized membrane protein YfcA